MKKLLGVTTLLTVLGVASFAHATATVDGITFPTGIVPGGNQLDSSVLEETVVTAAGQHDLGIGSVTTIVSGLNTVWQNGQNGVRLLYTFDYLASSVTAPTSTTNGTLKFSSGVVNFYVLPASTVIGATGTVAGDIAQIQAGTLFASTVAPKFDAAGDVLVSTIPAGSALTSFAGGTGQGDLDVTGGDAKINFATCTFANPFDTKGCSDLTFTSDFSTGNVTDGFGLSGSATVKANSVPEPLTLTIFGSGLVALGVSRYRKR